MLCDVAGGQLLESTDETPSRFYLVFRTLAVEDEEAEGGRWQDRIHGDFEDDMVSSSSRTRTSIAC